MMSDRPPLLLLLQGGLGNQLLQLVLAETLAHAQRRRLLGSAVLMESWSRRLRGLTPRSLSPVVRERLPLVRVPWHRYLVPRLTARLGAPHCCGVLTDRGLIEVAGDARSLERLSWVELMHTHATHPWIFGHEFTSSWMAVMESLRWCSPVKPVEVAVHVRRTDYLNPRSGFVPLGESYYRAALAGALALLPRYTRPPVIQICSDDPSWCRAHLQDPAWRLMISDGTPEQDLALMMNAQVLITSNSSLSAVAGHLAQLREPTASVLTPQDWLLREDGRLGDLRKANWEAVTL